MTLSILSSAQLVAQYCHRVYACGYTPAKTGNISLREEDRMFITPSGFSLADVHPMDVVEMGLEGKRLAGRNKPSGEWLMHAAVYSARPDVNAVIHAHPVAATALAAARLTLDPALVADVLMNLGAVPLVPYALPGSEELAQNVAHLAEYGNALILANHGVLALGHTIKDAYLNLELLENLARVTVTAAQLPGGPQPLTSEQVAEIIAVKHFPLLRPQADQQRH